ncbi:non-hydrolyzing UDP-N-acetylglucosamine 2-epimerase [Curtobacterium sp. VKM Ac-1393]|uniref:non-hydrolyzing UDP-N-acetylglucosamine 2-epimerase n=1 Tax=Curtobacterium sp. VKM Ac-1393 TaxID=2783814 RepID=UPI00188D431A|nr:UDP-N-acetylglucosamine 2-epimerase (non-hydrolyzing) [Curtobacterium sp. VKM Ac-1393]MBF4606080.1 UDP-N-acetylglucosamine 2-epimerase (non-hydrolyzing) [Curtobacterium sp. VKM Ac-1393]
MPIYGTRPEAIKFAPIVKALQSHSTLMSHVTVTGQHREMLDQVNEVFGIVPDTDLAILKPRQTLVDIATATMHGLDSLFSAERPDAVMVQGDTSTAFAAGLTAFYHQIPVVHLEAGLRSHDLRLPFPEEGNRKLLTQITSLHLAPTPHSRQNLLNEGVAADSIVVTGNSVIDALLQARSRDHVSFSDPALEQAVRSGRRILLVTSHRRENLGGGMEQIASALRTLATTHPDLLVVLPVHKNPAVREALLPPLQSLPNVLITEPVGYGEFVYLLNACSIVLTDSGGIQEEAPALGKPVLVMRDSTERPEAVEFGVVKLVGTDASVIVSSVDELLRSDDSYAAMSQAVNPYGDGRATERTIAALEALAADRPVTTVVDFAPATSE